MELDNTLWKYLIITLMLSGCTTPVMLGAGVASIAVSETTGKSVTDHTLSAINDRDCRMARALKDQQVCQNANSTLAQGNRVTESSVAEIEEVYRKRYSKR